MTSRRRSICRASSPAMTGGARAIPSRARAPILPRLRTKAVREGDQYIVNGQKTWTTLAQHADWIFCLVRTDPQAKAQEGISFLLIDMKTPGRHRAADHHASMAPMRSTMCSSKM